MKFNAYDDMCDEPDEYECVGCGGELHFQGRLGRLDCFRCRDCGLWAQRAAALREPDADVADEINVF